ncbi:4610_t:CDS:1, partial [Acaulospora colombiana]
ALVGAIFAVADPQKLGLVTGDMRANTWRLASSLFPKEWGNGGG